MNIYTHPTLEQLMGFIETSAVHVETPAMQNLNPLSRHLIHCVRCRNQVTTLSKFKDTFIANMPFLSTQQESAKNQHNSGISNQMLDEFVQGNMAEAEKSTLRKKMVSNKVAIKQALHFYLHSNDMRKHLDLASYTSVTEPVGKFNNTDVLDSDDSPSISDLDRNSGSELKTKLSSMFKILFVNSSSGSWVTIPISATIGVIVTLLVLLLAKTPQTTTMLIASYQDNPTITYQNAATVLPGTGFFNSSQQSVQPFGKLILELINATEIVVHWPSIPDAQQFNLRVYRIDANNRTLVSDVDTENNEVKITVPDLSTGRRFEWTLSGTRLNKGQFHTQGGFVIANKYEVLRDELL